MQALTALTATVRSWTNVNNRTRLPDSMIQSWITMAEERINEELRCAEMVRTVQGGFVASGQTLPNDFLEANYVKSVANPYIDYKYCTPEEYHRQVNRPPSMPLTSPLPLPPNSLQPYFYTIIGNALFVSPAVDPNASTPVELNYMAKLSPLADDYLAADGITNVPGINWMYARYTRLYTFASLALSAPFLVEDDRYATWESEASRLIALMNNRYRSTRAGKGPLRTNYRSFG